MTEAFDWFHGETNNGGRRLAFDIETDGLLDTVSVIHSLVIQDVDDGTVWSCHDHHPDEMWTYGTTCKEPTGPNVSFGLELLSNASVVFGHNILSYDIPAIERLVPGFELQGIARDTLILAKMIWPVDALRQLDFPRWRKNILPGQMIGAHRLEAWGYRMGLQKGEYSQTVKDLSKTYAEHGDLEQVPEPYRVLATTDAKGRPSLDPWKAWNVPMQEYCEVDVEVTTKLLSLIESHLHVASGTTLRTPSN